MKISNNYNQPSFKMAVKANQAAKALLRDSLNGKQLRKLNKIIERQQDNAHDILISTVQRESNLGKTKEYLSVIASNKEYQSGDFFKPLFTIKRAEKYVNKFKKMSFQEVFQKMGEFQ